MSMQNFWGVKEVHYGIVQVVNKCVGVIKSVISVIKMCAKCVVKCVIFPVTTWTRKIIRDLTKLLRGFQDTSCKERTRPLVQFDS